MALDLRFLEATAVSAFVMGFATREYTLPTRHVSVGVTGDTIAWAARQCVCVCVCVWLNTCAGGGKSCVSPRRQLGFLSLRSGSLRFGCRLALLLLTDAQALCWNMFGQHILFVGFVSKWTVGLGMDRIR